MNQPPRRYSVDDDIARPYDHRIGPKIDILLNGKRLSKVISFDVDAGTIERLVTDESGVILLNEARDEALREKLDGHVEVRWREQCLG